MDFKRICVMLVLFCYVHVVFGDITRFEDGTWDATFSVEHDGRMEAHTVLMFFMEINLYECTIYCIQHLQCKTVNYNTDQRLCELVDSEFIEDEAYPSEGWVNIGTPEKNGGFSPWKNATNCTNSCGYGTRRIYRECNNPQPKYGGAECVGDSGKTVECYGGCLRLINEMVGEWYIDDDDDMYTITELGAVTQRETGFTQTLQASDDDKNFPSSQGWLMVKGLHISGAWDYFRLEADGRLTLHTFRKDRNKVYNGLPNYCCKSIGIKKAIIPVGMVGKWNIHYTNDIKPIYEIRNDGSIKNDHEYGQDTFFQRSNNQNIFPSLHGWFGAKGLFGSTFDYIRLKSDGTLEIHHFSKTSSSIFNGLNKYCCSGKGVKIG